jgi:hypothetical protein
MPLVDALLDDLRPVFLFGSTPPKEGTDVGKSRASCAKFAARSAVLATDGFVVYDIQDECSRTEIERPFPFRKTIDPSLYASFFPAVSGKQCIIYKSTVNSSRVQFEDWLNVAVDRYGQEAFNLVGAASSKDMSLGLSLEDAARIVTAKGGCKFGCVCIPERQTLKGNEHLNMIRKMNYGAEWFITQGIFASDPLIKLVNVYGNECRSRGLKPKKVILTFAPCGRPKTMAFVKWLGMCVPEAVEAQIFASENPVSESVMLLCELFTQIIAATRDSGVPFGVNVESLSIFKEEIDAAHELFQRLQVHNHIKTRNYDLIISVYCPHPCCHQVILLNSTGSPWAIRWFFVERPLQFNPDHKSNEGSKSFNALVAASRTAQQPAADNTTNPSTTTTVTATTISCNNSSDDMVPPPPLASATPLSSTTDDPTAAAISAIEF